MVSGEVLGPSFVAIHRGRWCAVKSQSEKRPVGTAFHPIRITGKGKDMMSMQILIAGYAYSVSGNFVRPRTKPGIPCLLSSESGNRHRASEEGFDEDFKAEGDNKPELEPFLK